MNQLQKIGVALLAMALLIVIGFFVDNSHYWLIIDTILILGLGGCGVTLLCKRK